MTSAKLRTIISLSITALFILFGAAMLAFALPSGGWKALSVQTGSMKPNLNPGDLVLVHRVPASELSVGDVITFINPSNKKQTITHRIVQKDDSAKHAVFVTKGDANNSADRAISESIVVGRQEMSVPYLGRVVDFTHTIWGIMLIIWLPAFLIIFGETKRLSAYYRSVKPYLDPSLHVSRLHQATHRPTSNLSPLALVVTLGMVLTILSFAAPAFAATILHARLTDNVITTAIADEPQPPDNSGNTVTCTNNTNVNIQSNTNQHASSGDAVVQGNTTGGSATSGSVSNSSSTSVNVNVNNGPCVPAPATAPSQ